jgi:rubrerythrin
MHPTELPWAMAGEKADASNLGMEKQMNHIYFSKVKKFNTGLLFHIFENEAQSYHLYMNLTQRWNNPGARQIFQDMAEQELGPCDVLAFYRSDPLICERFEKVAHELAFQASPISFGYVDSDPFELINGIIDKVKQIIHFYKKILQVCHDHELKEFHKQLVLLKEQQFTLLHNIKKQFLSHPNPIPEPVYI